MDWNRFVYFPVLKTKDAEIRAISSVGEACRDKMLPIYEVTKSRRSKKDPDGDIAKRLNQIRDIQKKSPFILDITTDQVQINPQIESILKPTNGYEHWREWLKAYSDCAIVPAIHINFEEDDNLEQTKRFIKMVSSEYSRMALRLPIDLEESDYISLIESVVSELNGSKIYLLLDAGCVRKEISDKSIGFVVGKYKKVIDSIFKIQNRDEWLQDLVCISGSFPQSVVSVSGDECGEFDIYEQSLYLSLKEYLSSLKFGDYASINISQTEIRGGTFVPRIDFCTDSKFFYYRKRRESGSYIWCANQVVNDPNYSSKNNWGDEEIVAAADGKPSGISPSFWISVRASNYMIRRVHVLSV